MNELGSRDNWHVERHSCLNSRGSRCKRVTVFFFFFFFFKLAYAADKQ